ncbi:MAG: prepilin-type N-terminal cleavage/methylation domain-containing protein [Deinococcota bacterium]
MKYQSTSTPNPQARQGFTLVELLVVLGVSILVITASVNVTIASNRMFRVDRVRTRMNQDLRAASDLIGADVRTAGSYLPNVGLQSIVVRGGNELEIRRSLLSTQLPVCKKINGGSNADVVFVSENNPKRPECDRDSRDLDGDGQADDHTEWVDYRTDTEVNPNQTVAVYIWPSEDGQGEFFTYDAEDGSNQHIHKASGKWQHDYDPESTPPPNLYVMEMRRYQLTDGVLELIINDNEDNPLRLVNNITEFRVRAILTDGSVVEDFGENPEDRFTDIASVEIDVQAADQVTPQTRVERELNNRFFPRNILNF